MYHVYLDMLILTFFKKRDLLQKDLNQNSMFSTERLTKYADLLFAFILAGTV